MRWRQVVAGLSTPQRREGQVQLLPGPRWREALEEAPGAPSPLYQPSSELPLPQPCCPLLQLAAPCPLLAAQHLSRLLQTVLNAPLRYPSLPHLYQPSGSPKGPPLSALTTWPLTAVSFLGTHAGHINME